MKICIVGYSASGKSTLAAALGRRYGAAVLHLDRVQFAAGWVERPLADKQRDVEEFLNTHADWIIEGNYSALLYDRRMAEADRIVVLALNRWACLARATARWRRYRGRTRPDMAEGCAEKLDAGFVRWILWDGRTRAHRARLARLAQTCPGKVTVLKNQRALTRFYETEGLA